MTVPVSQYRPVDARHRLVFALDYPSTEEALVAARRLRGHVGLFKIGLEMFLRGGPEFVRRIAADGGDLFLDLKLHDIPATVRAAARAAAQLPIRFLSVHATDGASILAAAVEGSGPQVAVLAVSVLTSLSESDLAAAGTLGVASIPELVMRRAELARAAGCAGIVCSGLEVGALRRRFGSDWIAMVPGIRPLASAVVNDDQKRACGPAAAIAAGADYIVVGRPIRLAPDPVRAADAIVAEIDGSVTEAGRY